MAVEEARVKTRTTFRAVRPGPKTMLWPGCSQGLAKSRRLGGWELQRQLALQREQAQRPQAAQARGGSGGISALLFYGWLTGSRGRALLLLGGGNKWRLLSATEGLAPLTAAELQKTARGMSGSAGPDGWSAAEPASLPHFVSDAFGSLAQNRPLPSRLD